jgi:hypothetical protein
MDRYEIATARWMARKAVKAQWRDEGRKRDYRAHDLAIAGDDYLSGHPELLARAKLRTSAQKPNH